MKTQKLKELAQQATPWPWKWFTSNSHNRLSSVPSGKDGDVISAFKAVDGVACVSVSRADMAFIEAAHPGAVIELIERLEAAERERDELRLRDCHQCGEILQLAGALNKAEAELARRDAAAGEPVGLQYMGDNGKWQDCASREVAESYGFTQFRELYTGAPDAVLPASVPDAQAKPFMYAIADCDGRAHFDEFCVSDCPGNLVDTVDALNDFREDGDIGYSIVPLYAAPPAASVQDGYRLVPVEPTQCMIDAHTEGMVSGGATKAYRAMLAAAPAPDQ